MKDEVLVAAEVHVTVGNHPAHLLPEFLACKK